MRAAFGLRQARHVARSFSSTGAPARPPAVPLSARVVVCGGGIIGTSVAYHLAKLGWSDTVLLEREQLTSGTTWHAAGLMVTFGGLSETSTEFRKYSKELYSTLLPQETGLSTGFMPVGFIELATSPDYLEEFRRVAAFNRKCGVDVHEIGPAEVEQLFPLCNVEDVLAGFYVENDGRVNPVDATAALAKGARNRGVKIVEGCEVLSVVERDGRVCGVRTSGGEIECEYVVNAAGMWARQLAELSGVAVPNQAAEHYYLLTDSLPEVGKGWPVIEDPSRHTYIRPEGGGLLVGLFETDAAAWNVPAIPRDFTFGEIEPDWERIAPFLEKASTRKLVWHSSPSHSSP
jgi:glycine/D-amino acid oxidase-like deaminating enzyme